MINYQSILTASNAALLFLCMLIPVSVIGGLLICSILDRFQEKVNKLNKRVARMEGSNTKNYL